MRKLIKQHLSRSHLEVVVIVEAIDPHSSNTFQARHSYMPPDSRAPPPPPHVHTCMPPVLDARPLAHTHARRAHHCVDLVRRRVYRYTAEDILFDHSFEASMQVAADGQAQLNWDLFHKTKASPFKCASTRLQPAHTATLHALH
jgi:hypothetical protein